MKVVYALETAVVGQYTVSRGEIWPADDPVVRMQPTLFTEDPRPLLRYSTPPNDLEQSHLRAKTEKVSARR